MTTAHTPIPAPEHKTLERMAGNWLGTETLFPSAWTPQKSQHSSQVNARMLEGFFLISDYEQRDEMGKEVTYRGHGVYSWNPEKSCYVMYWFDSMGGAGGVANGTLEGDVLTFSTSSPMGEHRYRYTFEESGYRFEMAMSQNGEEWQILMEAAYRRA